MPTSYLGDFKLLHDGELSLAHTISVEDDPRWLLARAVVELL